MFIGHFGVGLAAKKVNSKLSLGTLFLASQFIDLLWPIFLLFGWESVKIESGNTAFTPLNFVYYPFSHSLLGVLIWAFLFGLIYYFIKKNYKASILLGVLVISYWVLDLLTHKPDLQIFPWSNVKVGFGLWNSVLFTMIVESIIFVAGIYFYQKTTKANNKKGSLGFWMLILFLSIIYLMNIFGSPPPNETAIGIVGLSQWLLIVWAYRIDKNRTKKS